jgi:molybdopterin molybdotransferase
MGTQLLSVEAALAEILAVIKPVASERVDLLSAWGRILAEEIIAPANVPLMANSAMDGYAVQAADTVGATPAAAVTLSIIGDLPAGYLADRPVETGQALRIMTGAPLPAGADAVVMVEVTAKQGDQVAIYAAARPGQYVRPVGEDIQQGERLMGPGTVLTAAEIGLLAAVQRPWVCVYRQPRVAILSTGDELVEIDQPLTPSKVVNSNSYSLAALVKAAGGIPTICPIIPDDPRAIATAIKNAMTADFILSSGGVSVGEYDHVKPVLTQLGAEIKFWRVAMKPGKPLVFAVLQDKPYFGLPGNTVSSMLSFLLFVQPSLRKALGQLPPFTAPTIPVILETAARSKGDRRTYLRAKVRYEAGKFYAQLASRQGSGVLSSMLSANALVILPEGTTEVAAGEEISALVIGKVL